ncbi:serine hydrolase [Flavobacterium sp. IMCC34852]|uniref:Serine hydrolase n=1 Tax=Flavobacterium rivulicola TaxID=2732161 RepID=A0A7Y3RBY5_9FLAO|nr:serine hydrolase domain-containing protein [Flavobacterium sp. IMCC34852]NNT73132.1 serine hydrolase [Flavobacterium sp. IMCC34852]
MTKRISVALLFLFLTTTSFAQNNYAKLDSLFALLESNNKFMGSVAISEGGKILYSKSVGVTDMYTRKRATVATKYRIGSISKMFTSAMIFKAVEEKKITLDQTIEAYFPSVPNAKKITISNLLNHRSGIYNITNSGDYWTYYTQPKTEAEMVAIIAKNKSDFEPDSKADYSNSNYILLSYILEKVYKKTYGEILTEKITKPLNLKNTYLGNRISLGKNECYSFSYKEEWVTEKETDPSIPIGAGAIVSNPTDLAIFIENLFAGKIISKKSLDQMTTIKDNYGMGIFQLPFDKRKGFGHTGGIDGFSSSLGYFPDSNVSVALTSNGNNFDNNQIMIALLSTYYAIPFEMPSFKTVALTEEELDKYLGNYASEELAMTIKVTRKADKLFAQATGQDEFPLDATKADTFEFLAAGIKIKFALADKQMTLLQGGKSYLFRKI